jgi:allophanate hydrolase
MDTRLHVEAAGPLTTVQDGGRRGYMRFGVGASGAIDRFAMAAANVAVGNHADAALLETSGGGVTLRCEGSSIGFALCGGDAAATVDDRSLGNWVAGMLLPGERLRVSTGKLGNWACLAVAGRLDTPTWLGSQATHALSGLGGGIVRAGDVLVVRDPRMVERLGPVSIEAKPPIETVRIVPGPQERFFAADAIARLTSTEFIATAEFDRMGRRLEGPRLHPLAIDMPSEPAVRGALQIDGDGRTTILLADHQTTGGYPKIAVVIDPDIDRLAQLPPGRRFGFEVVSLARAIAISREGAADARDRLRRIATRMTFEERLRSASLVSGVVDAHAPD